MATRLDKLTNLVLVGTALLVAFSVVRREFVAPARASAVNQADKAISDAQWARLQEVSLPIGSRSATDTVIEFVDVECPFCKRAHGVLDSMLATMDSGPVVLIAHLPLPQHRFAQGGAWALECAHRQGRLAPMLAAVFAGQDSIGLLDWKEFAHRAEVQSLGGFAECIESSVGTAPGVAATRELARDLKVTGTPSFIVNRVHLGAPPDELRWRQLLKASMQSSR